MIVYEIAMNGATVRAGAPDQTSLSLRLNSGEGFASPQLDVWAFRVSGQKLEKHYQWEFAPLRIGDQITIRLIDEARADAPTKISDSDPKLTRDEKVMVRHQIAKLKRFNKDFAKRVREISAEASADPTMKYCSFCGRSQHEVAQLIAGPAVFICDICVDVCVTLQKEG